ncbi:uncharacterized protein TRIADDRAFT_28018 [Trichoplax adhaerens]|uniref:Kynureninase n=1 Tax=Trichoplax adhaerens TaxID=10228 RepID=B3S0Z2_TRIAD|nr:hypothetical protein TRIADDRAFT_28018 [Trichoplax adhaerens]EDV23147.1 hypothetical protein TRIADDRAFT_28018 [Trichoplax adhaerens]|eukprot:XP_002114057.1 hypothetical protein TRIADDRAFT_28018 [Trichoplax adhaerens]
MDEAASHGYDIASCEFAQYLDSQDKFKEFRELFYIPRKKTLPLIDLSLVDGESESIYLLGNSLGLQPKQTRQRLIEHLDKWAEMGIEGQFHGNDRWVDFQDTMTKDLLCPIVGAKPIEICVMNAVTVNIHLLMISFYQPTAERCKILIEDGAFPSDHYAVQSQIRMRGYDPDDAMIIVKARDGETTIRTEDVIAKINEFGDSIAMILLPGVQFYTCQLFDIKEITKAAHDKGCNIGWDLCHAAGAVELKLHEWDVDFAVWCSYKYLNSGPGSVSACFVHEKHAHRKDFNRLEGWFGHRLETRFDMSNVMESIPGASGFQISNTPVAEVVKLVSSLDIYSRVSLPKLFEKARKGVIYMEALYRHYFMNNATSTDCKKVETVADIISPTDPFGRGNHLAFKFSGGVDYVCDGLAKRGIVVDVRRNEVIRASFAPLYNSFQDVYTFITTLHDLFTQGKKS